VVELARQALKGPMDIQSGRSVVSTQFNGKRARGEVQATGSGYGGSHFQLNAQEAELCIADRMVPHSPNQTTLPFEQFCLLPTQNVFLLNIVLSISSYPFLRTAALAQLFW